jgi:hypothetical protein
MVEHMSVNNIVDHRTNSYNVECDIIFEPCWHDNSVKGSTKFELIDDERYFMFDELRKTTVSRGLEYAKKWDLPTTMYIYDIGYND